MSIDWKLIFTDNNLQRITVLKNLLEANGIPAQIINKIDSSYPSIGSAELYADGSRLDEAVALIKKAEGEE